MDTIEPQDNSTESPEQNTPDSVQQAAHKQSNKIIGLIMMIYWIPVIGLFSYLHISMPQRMGMEIMANAVLGFAIFRGGISHKLPLWITIRVLWGIAFGIVDLTEHTFLSWLGVYEILIWIYIAVRYRQPFGEHSLRIASWLLLPLSLGALVNVFIEFGQRDVYHKVAVYNKRENSSVIILLTNMEKSIHRYMLRVRIVDDSIGKLAERFYALENPDMGLPILDSLAPLDSDRQVNVNACLPILDETITKVKEYPDADSLTQRAGLDLLQGYKKLYGSYQKEGPLLDSLRTYTKALQHSKGKKQDALYQSRDECMQKIRTNGDHMNFTLRDVSEAVHRLGLDE